VRHNGAAVTREIQNIPPAPRQVRWPTGLWSRWPIAAAGAMLVVCGGLWTWMLFLGSLGGQIADERLDAGAAVTDGQILAVEPAPTRRYDDQVWAQVTYSIRDQSGQWTCFAPAGVYRSGDACTVEVLRSQPHTHRVAGGRRHLIPAWARPQLYLGLVVFPGLLLLCLWLQGVFETRRLVADGDIAVAEILECRRVQGVVPGMLCASYRFKDWRARDCRGRHWLRARSELGTRLLAGESRLPVAVHRRWSRLSRLVVPTYFDGSRPTTGHPLDEPSLEA